MGRHLGYSVRRLVLCVFLLVALFSGCTDPGEEASDPQDPPPETRPETEARADQPEWELGDGWRYLVDMPGQRTRTVTMIVAEDRDDLFVVASAHEDQALDQVLYGTNPMLGRNGKDTLAPFQGGEPVEMYRFPLTDGKRWNATLFDEDMSVRAGFSGDIEVQPELELGGFVQGFEITARGDSGTQLHYDYVDAVGWFTSFEVQDGDGERLIRLDLIERIEDYQGPYQFYRREPVLQETFVSSPDEPMAADVAVPDSKRSPDGLVVGVAYRGAPSSLPPVANVTLTDEAGEVLEPAYFERQFSGLGQSFVRYVVPIDAACIDPGDDSCTGSLRFNVTMLGETEVVVRASFYQVFAEGSL